MVDEPKRSAQNSGPRRGKHAPIADSKAREILRSADRVLARLSGDGRARLTDVEVEAARWRPYRSLAVSHLFASQYGA